MFSTNSINKPILKLFGYNVGIQMQPNLCILFEQSQIQLLR